MYFKVQVYVCACVWNGFNFYYFNQESTVKNKILFKSRFFDVSIVSKSVFMFLKPKA